jgi:hypothetical protein
MPIAIDSHEHGDPREKMPGPLDDVEMTGCDRIEGAGIDRMLPQPAPADRIEHRPRLPPAAWVTSPSCGLAWVR